MNNELHETVARFCQAIEPRIPTDTLLNAVKASKQRQDLANKIRYAEWSVKACKSQIQWHTSTSEVTGDWRKVNRCRASLARQEERLEQLKSQQ